MKRDHAPVFRCAARCAPGESCAASFTLTPRQLGVWNDRMRFVVEPGAFEVVPGASFADVKITALTVR